MSGWPLGNWGSFHSSWDSDVDSPEVRIVDSLQQLLCVLFFENFTKLLLGAVQQKPSLSLLSSSWRHCCHLIHRVTSWTAMKPDNYGWLVDKSVASTEQTHVWYPQPDFPGKSHLNIQTLDVLQRQKFYLYYILMQFWWSLFEWNLCKRLDYIFFYNSSICLLFH